MSTVKGKTEYFSSLTALRGIAALWVVLFHIDVSIFYRDLGALIPHSWSGIISSGYLWVDFFFILSGFVIAHVYGERFGARFGVATLVDYLVTRFRRVYPLHLFTLLILVLLAPVSLWLAPSIADSSWATYFALDALWSNLLLLNAMNQHVYLSWNIVSWSIGAEWWTYCVAVGLLMLVSGKALRAQVLIMAASFSLLAGLYYLHPGNNLDITFDYGFARCLFEFSIGVSLYKMYQIKLGRYWLKRDSVIVGLFLLIGCVFHWQLNDLFIVPIYSALVLGLAYNKKRTCSIFSKPVFQYLGKISYSIYMMHGVWFMVFWFLLPFVKKHFQLVGFSPLTDLLYVVMFIGFTLISAHFSYRYIEVPGRRLYGRKILQVQA